MSSDTYVIRHARILGGDPADLVLRDGVIADITAAGAASAEGASISMPSTASSARRRIIAASRPVVSPLPPAPGLSWVSASTTGAPGSPRCIARLTAS